jgi:hypothetical protein
MSILIKDMKMPTTPVLFCIHPDGKVFADLEGGWREYNAVPISPHGRLIDADEFLKRAIGTKCFRGDYALMLEELVGESTTIIPADEVV